MVELERDFEHCRRLLGERLREPAPGRIQLLTGPRQVGKTTLLLELARQFGEAAVYMAGDEPDAALPGFWERCWTRGRSPRARHNRPAAGRDPSLLARLGGTPQGTTGPPAPAAYAAARGRDRFLRPARGHGIAGESSRALRENDTQSLAGRRPGRVAGITPCLV